MAWWFFSSEAPSSHKTISNEEKTYIDSALALNTSSVANKVHRATSILRFHDESFVVTLTLRQPRMNSCSASVIIIILIILILIIIIII